MAWNSWAVLAIDTDNRRYELSCPLRNTIPQIQDAMSVVTVNLCFVSITRRHILMRQINPKSSYIVKKRMRQHVDALAAKATERK